jgi:hypothetical protein
MGLFDFLFGGKKRKKEAEARKPLAVKSSGGYYASSRTSQNTNVPTRTTEYDVVDLPIPHSFGQPTYFQPIYVPIETPSNESNNWTSGNEPSNHSNCSSSNNSSPSSSCSSSSDSDSGSSSSCSSSSCSSSSCSSGCGGGGD